jgi:uncharacterized membrane protein YbhN (UPF0104 family)
MPPNATGAPGTRLRVRPRVLIQVALTLIAFGYVIHKANLRSLGDAFHRAPSWSVPAAVLALLAVMFAGSLRWRLLLTAYGAQTALPISTLFRLQLIGLFYNMLPGAVGGDVLRGVVSRRAFGTQGLSAGLVVVLVERVFGLIALMLLVVGVLAIHPIRMLRFAPWVFALGAAGSVGTLVAIAWGRRLAPRLPARLGRHAAELPELANVPAFVMALGVSVVNQALVGLTGHLTIWPLAHQVGVLDSLALAPLAFAAIFFPLTVAGAGTREAAMMALYGLIDVPRDDALSASLEVLMAYGIVAAIGGALSLATPLRATDESA